MKEIKQPMDVNYELMPPLIRSAETRFDPVTKVKLSLMANLSTKIGLQIVSYVSLNYFLRF